MEKKILIIFLIVGINLTLSNSQVTKKQLNANTKRFNSKSNEANINNPYEKNFNSFHEIPVGIASGSNNDDTCQLNIACSGGINLFQIKKLD